jgi:hypothetical protein
MISSHGFTGIEDVGETKVCDAGSEVRTQENVLRLEVPVSDGRFDSLHSVVNLFVEKCESLTHRHSHLQQLRPSEHVAL